MRLRRGSAIMTAIMLLFGMVAVAFFGTDIIMGALARRRVEGASLKAYYAAEGASEKVFLALKMNKNNLLKVCKSSFTAADFDFAASPPVCRAIPLSQLDQLKTLMENDALLPSYYSHLAFPAKANPNDVQVDSRGLFGSTARQLTVTFCLPDCRSKNRDDDDGCGGLCQECQQDCEGKAAGDPDGCNSACP